MTKFPQLPNDDYDVIYLEDTDQPLPEKLNPKTRYIRFKTIAQGGKATIYSCRDLHLNRTICYKKLRSELANDPVELHRLIREARVSAMLQHPNTPPIYELGRDNHGVPYFTMKLVHGYTLREVLDYRERYDLSQLIEVIRQVGNALDFAHSHRVIHRDIKPENILNGPFGEVLVLDWGLAKVWRRDHPESEEAVADDLSQGEEDPVTHLTGNAKLQGTVTYMSPEQLLKDPNIDYRSDVFSLGVVLYEILAGRTPHVQETVREMKESILNDSPAPPSAYTKVRIPSLLQDLAMGCIEKDPANRPHDCGEIVRLLHEDWR